MALFRSGRQYSPVTLNVDLDVVDSFRGVGTLFPLAFWVALTLFFSKLAPPSYLALLYPYIRPIV
jgi:hypothetical protein